MSFIINHSDLFIGIIVIIVLALIGYYADKNGVLNNSKNKSNDSKNKKSDDIKIENSGIDEFSAFNQLPDSDNRLNNDLNDFKDNSVDDYSSNIISEPNSGSVNDISSNVSESISEISNNVVDSDNDVLNQFHLNSFGSNDFESTNFSLEDLEKRNFEQLSNGSKLDDNDNFYYSDMEDSNVSVISPVEGSQSDFSTIDGQISLGGEGSSDISVSDDINNNNVHESDFEVQDSSQSNINLENSDILTDVKNIGSESVVANQVVNEFANSDVSVSSDNVINDNMHEFDFEVQDSSQSNIDLDDSDTLTDVKNIDSDESGNEVSNSNQLDASFKDIESDNSGSIDGDNNNLSFSDNVIADSNETIPELFNSFGGFSNDTDSDNNNDNDNVSTLDSSSSSATTNDSSLNLDDTSIDDDIWKF